MNSTDISRAGRPRARRLVAGFVVACVVLTGAALVPASPAAAALPSSRAFSGGRAAQDQKEWFNTPFSFDAGRLGRVRGRLRFVTDTSALLTSERVVATGDPRSFAAGNSVAVQVRNDPAGARLRITARPALQLLFEWQPHGDPLVCDVNTFPAMGDDWFRRTDGGGPVAQGVCGAIEVTADDLNPIFQQLGIDLELPEVFQVLDRTFTPGFTGTTTLTQSHQLFEIKVCKIATDFFGLPLGDRCGIQLNAEIGAPLTTTAHSLTAQACTSAFVPHSGTEVPCAIDLGGPQTLAYTSPLRSFSAPGVCPDRTTSYGVRVSQVRWLSSLAAVDVGLSIDLNVRLTEGGSGWDVATIQLPGSVNLLGAPMNLNMTLTPSSTMLHVGSVSPDQAAPLVLVPAVTTVHEGSPATVAPLLLDACTPTDELDVRWTLDGSSSTGTTLSRTYPNDLPQPSHQGTVRAIDSRGNGSSPSPFEIRVRNVPPGVTLGGVPRSPVPTATSLSLSAPVTDPGSDVVSWTWAFGDGTFANRTAADASDRTDARTKAYSLAGIYPLRVSASDGTDSATAQHDVVVYDPSSRLVGSATYMADDQALNVPRGSSYRVDANLAYRESPFPVGTFTTAFTRLVQGSPQPSSLTATGFEWYLERPGSARLQGFAELDGEGLWKFRLDLTRSTTSPLGTVATFSVWRPGVTTLENPDYRFGGPRDTGNIL